MPNYRRMWIAGRSIFFTVNLADRSERLLIAHANALRAAFCEVKQARPFQIDAIVLLPDHLHCIWTLPPNDVDYSTRWRFLKARFSGSVSSGEATTPSRRARRERGIWQRRFWDHVIRSEADFHAHLDYIHYNPVKHGHVTAAIEWPYSSFMRFVRAGHYPSNWGTEHAIDGRFGER